MQVPAATSQTWPTRLPLLILCLLVGVLTVGGTPPLLATLPAALLLVMVCSATATGPGREAAFVGVAALVVAAITVTVPFPLVALAFPSLPIGVPILLGVLAAVSSIAAAVRPRWFYPHLALQGGLLVAMVTNLSPRGDVKVMVEGSLRGLMRGENPYSMTFPNPYTPEETAEFWPADYISGDRIDVGFPYLPGALIGDLPGHVVGDVRLASVAAVLLTAVLAWRLTSDVAGRVLVAALPTSVLAMTTVLGYWVEPLLLLGVALLAWSVANGREATGIVGLTLLLTVKQYAVVLLPLEKLVRLALGVRTVVVGAGVAGALILGFFLAGPADFWRATVQLALDHPFRSDSTSLSVDLVNLGVPVPRWAMTTASLGGSLAVAIWLRATATASGTWTALGVGLTLLTTVLLSQAGHVNYYFVIYGSLVIGFASWPADVPRSAPGASNRRSESLLVERNERES